jgi:hypothetical protein
MDQDERRARKQFAASIRLIRHIGPSTADRLGGRLSARNCERGDVEQMEEAYSQAKYALTAIPRSDRARYGKHLQAAHCQVRSLVKMQKATCSLFRRPARQFEKRAMMADDASVAFWECRRVQQRR